jgi:hypothetical protein
MVAQETMNVSVIDASGKVERVVQSAVGGSSSQTQGAPNQTTGSYGHTRIYQSTEGTSAAESQKEAAQALAQNNPLTQAQSRTPSQVQNAELLAAINTGAIGSKSTGGYIYGNNSGVNRGVDVLSSSSSRDVSPSKEIFQSIPQKTNLASQLLFGDSGGKGFVGASLSIPKMLGESVIGGLKIQAPGFANELNQLKAELTSGSNQGVLSLENNFLEQLQANQLKPTIDSGAGLRLLQEAIKPITITNESPISMKTNFIEQLQANQLKPTIDSGAGARLIADVANRIPAGNANYSPGELPIMKSTPVPASEQGSLGKAIIEPFLSSSEKGIPDNNFIEQLQSNQMKPNVDSGAFGRLVGSIPGSDFKYPSELGFIPKTTPVPESQQGVLGKEFIQAITSPSEKGVLTMQSDFAEQLQSNIPQYQIEQGAGIRNVSEALLRLPGGDFKYPSELGFIPKTTPVPESMQGVLGEQFLQFRSYAIEHGFGGPFLSPEIIAHNYPKISSDPDVQVATQTAAIGAGLFLLPELTTTAIVGYTGFQAQQSLSNNLAPGNIGEQSFNVLASGATKVVPELFIKAGNIPLKLTGERFLPENIASPETLKGLAEGTKARYGSATQDSVLGAKTIPEFIDTFSIKNNPYLQELLKSKISQGWFRIGTPAESGVVKPSLTSAPIEVIKSGERLYSGTKELPLFENQQASINARPVSLETLPQSLLGKDAIAVEGSSEQAGLFSSNQALFTYLQQLKLFDLVTKREFKLFPSPSSPELNVILGEIKPIGKETPLTTASPTIRLTAFIEPTPANVAKVTSNKLMLDAQLKFKNEPEVIYPPGTRFEFKETLGYVQDSIATGGNVVPIKLRQAIPAEDFQKLPFSERLQIQAEEFVNKISSSSSASKEVPILSAFTPSSESSSLRFEVPSSIISSESSSSYASSIPSLPSFPSTPSTPSAPSTPSLPSIPSVPSIPSLPSFPSTPSTPSAPSLPFTLSNPLSKKDRKNQFYLLFQEFGKEVQSGKVFESKGAAEAFGRDIAKSSIGASFKAVSEKPFSPTATRVRFATGAGVSSYEYQPAKSAKLAGYSVEKNKFRISSWGAKEELREAKEASARRKYFGF